MTFNGLGIAPKILENLGKLNFKVPTPIQHQSIPSAIQGKDLIGIAQTGTGKTLAFGIPLIQRVAETKSNGLILLPTRELALQVGNALNRMGGALGLKTVILIGGENMSRQIRDLRSNYHVIVATPGRLIDHLRRKTVSLNRVSVLILDEADRMLDMGFEPQIKQILQSVPEKKQTMLFSATMPPQILKIINSYMKSPVRVEVTPSGTAAENVTHEVFFVDQRSKIDLLENILENRKGNILVFSRTKHNAKKVALTIKEKGHSATEIHSNKSLNQRLSALSGFKSGLYRIMVATDIAARGIDVSNIELVVNYDLPGTPDDYVHRIGRTGRAGRSGHAISFATPDQRFEISSIERLIKKHLTVSELPELPKRQTGFSNSNQFARRGRFSNNRSSGNYFGRRRVFNSRPRRYSA
ncbi:MAG: DEAD/DEAH box helicase [Candidatus Pacebacteria bacterium]|nr:DEAD/DEAH box helicase [Candidatus Paceibacterota bacterium]